MGDNGNDLPNVGTSRTSHQYEQHATHPPDATQAASTGPPRCLSKDAERGLRPHPPRPCKDRNFSTKPHSTTIVTATWPFPSYRNRSMSLRLTPARALCGPLGGRGFRVVTEHLRKLPAPGRRPLFYAPRTSEAPTSITTSLQAAAPVSTQKLTHALAVPLTVPQCPWSAMTDEALFADSLDGYRQPGLEAWGASPMRTPFGIANVMVSGGIAVSEPPRLRSARSEC